MSPNLVQPKSSRILIYGAVLFFSCLAVSLNKFFGQAPLGLSDWHIEVPIRPRNQQICSLSFKVNH